MAIYQQFTRREKNNEVKAIKEFLIRKKDFVTKQEFN